MKKSRILITHPGKLGDLIYCLGTIKAVSLKYEVPVNVQISSHCQNIKKLLLTQDYISKVYVDLAYTVKHQHRGYQPYNLASMDGYDHVFELGYRESDTYDLHNQALSDYGYFAMKEFYKIDLEKAEYPHVTIPFSPQKNESYFVFQGFGETLDVVLGPEKVNSVMLHWAAVLRSTNKKFYVLTGPREVSRYANIGFDAVISNDLLDTSTVLKGAKGIIASQSVVAALSNAMQLPRMILSLFPNALPQGFHGKHITLLDESVSTAETLIEWIESCSS